MENNPKFYNFPNLEEINFPTNLIKIGEYAFAKQNIKNIKISKNTKYEENTFFNSDKNNKIQKGEWFR